MSYSRLGRLRAGEEARKVRWTKEEKALFTQDMSVEEIMRITGKPRAAVEYRKSAIAAANKNTPIINSTRRRPKFGAG